MKNEFILKFCQCWGRAQGKPKLLQVTAPREVAKPPQQHLLGLLGEIQGDKNYPRGGKMLTR